MKLFKVAHHSIGALNFTFYHSSEIFIGQLFRDDWHRISQDCHNQFLKITREERFGRWSTQGWWSFWCSLSRCCSQSPSCSSMTLRTGARRCSTSPPSQPKSKKSPPLPYLIKRRFFYESWHGPHVKTSPSASNDFVPHTGVHCIIQPLGEFWKQTKKHLKNILVKLMRTLYIHVKSTNEQICTDLLLLWGFLTSGF